MSNTKAKCRNCSTAVKVKVKVTKQYVSKSPQIYPTFSQQPQFISINVFERQLKNIKSCFSRFDTFADTAVSLCTAAQLKGDFEGLDTALGELGANHSYLTAAGEGFVCTIYGFPVGTSIAEARHQYKNTESPLKSWLCHQHMQTSLLHINKAHHAVILSKLANKKQHLDSISEGSVGR